MDKSSTKETRAGEAKDIKKVKEAEGRKMTLKRKKTGGKVCGGGGL